jgi:fatty acid desaturase
METITSGRHATTNSGPREEQPERRTLMLWTIAIILVILWALGLVSSYTLGGFIHILLVLAIIVVVVGFLQGRRA